MPAKRKPTTGSPSSATIGFAAKLCLTADKLRNNMDAAEPSAEIRVMVKRSLNKHGYPPDLPQEAVKTVLMQPELLCPEWV